MLMQSSLPSSIEAALSFTSDHCKKDLVCDWLPSGGTAQKCPKCEECTWDCGRECITSMQEKENLPDSHSLVHSKNCSKLSTDSDMCAGPALSFVYKRRKLQSNSVTPLCSEAAKSTAGSGVFVSNASLLAPSLPSDKDNLSVQITNEVCSAKPPAMAINVCNKDTFCSANAAIPVTSLCSNDLPGRNTSINDQVYLRRIKTKVCSEVVPKLESINKFRAGEQRPSDEILNSNHTPDLTFNNVNDSCSSSKSNMRSGSPSRIETDETGECSSSILTKDFMEEGFSEKEFCISILRNHGLLEGVLSVGSASPVDVSVTNGDSNKPLECKICRHSENQLDMLICDNCEAAFHVSCCNPRIKKIPVDEWYCRPCSAKKHKRPQETATAKNGGPACRNRTSRSGLSPIELMLKDPEPYITGVRIGKAFQAEVPEWTAPILDDFNYFDEPLRLDRTECGCSYGLITIKPSTSNSIGNWLQCQELLDDSTGQNPEGILCGKWRRAPLFEVQTDDWDCSCAVLWDPLHSDCAVPQELETDQVLMHLKYVELLRPRLAAAKKRKQNLSKGSAECAKHGGDL